MNSSYLKPSQLEDLLIHLLLILLDPRTFIEYDLICNVLAAVVVSMQKRGLYVNRIEIRIRKFTSVLRKVVTSECIPNVNCLGLLLLRIPVVNPILVIFRSVLSFYVLNRLY